MCPKFVFSYIGFYLGIYWSVQEVRSFSTVEELETFILKHGENIVDLMGGEIDRIEMNLRVWS